MLDDVAAGNIGIGMLVKGVELDEEHARDRSEGQGLGRGEAFSGVAFAVADAKSFEAV